ncbi:transmembrane protein, putative (macronuclear) [Tetrahymena thermophila SB210]|uniref:Transmembrane protein, putative n=1 Tax=Tetrahymena thermophila (strain SB210) TaxID=312017 RepID=W7XHW3_TETTS|nr:transmembrane protein, putative [Tetrahymena thermophila SB210]EWS74106.1 transmembrane protein, putative [Tetrahymena thermophila SB210]|eukprot:XP_012653361.1 transmembrane protein, putative [Tetrahymena thermophila SB210]
MDQIISYNIQHIKQKVKKLKFKILHNLLFIKIFYSYIIYIEKTKERIILLEYNQRLIFSLIEELQNNQKQQELLPIEQSLSKAQSREIGEEYSLQKGSLKKCFVCYTKNQSKKSSFYCQKHEINVCIIPCYNLQRKSVFF